MSSSVKIGVLAVQGAFAEHIKSEREKWARVIRASGASVD